MLEEKMSYITQKSVCETTLKLFKHFHGIRNSISLFTLSNSVQFKMVYGLWHWTCTETQVKG